MRLLDLFVLQAIAVLPWLLGGLAVVAVVSYSPLGRGLLGFFRTRKEERAVNEQLLTELEELRRVLLDVTERLDSTERRLAEEARAGGWGKPLPPAKPDHPVTPH